MSARSTALVVGAGGREHALARALATDGADVIVAPGNPGMPDELEHGSIRIDARSPAEIDADLVVVGPEVPLVAGLADELRNLGRLVVGPGADGARLEGSKAFMKQLLDEAGVPTARHVATDDRAVAEATLRSLQPPYVVKTDGLAAGKGVLVTESLDEAINDVADKLGGRSFGEAGRTVVIEEGLVGPECSFIVLCDGSSAVPFAPAQDFKRLEAGDLGPNTGGMGAYSPMPTVDGSVIDAMLDEIIAPTMAALRARSIDYRGLLYAGLMLTEEGPKVIEYNVRFGDPEAQAILPRLEPGFLEVLLEAASGSLVHAPRFTSDAAVTVVLAAPGYPSAPTTGAPISGLDARGQLAEPIEGVTVFHAGTARPDPAGPFLVAGGRVMAVTATGASIGEARSRAITAAGQIHFEGVQMRHDIAAGAAEREGAR